MKRAITASQVSQLLATKGFYADKIHKSRKFPGAYVVREGFYYRHGQSQFTIADKLKKAVQAQIVIAREEYASWPKDSYWEVIFRLPQWRINALAKKIDMTDELVQAWEVYKADGINPAVQLLTDQGNSQDWSQMVVEQMVVDLEEVK